MSRIISQTAEDAGGGRTHAVYGPGGTVSAYTLRLPSGHPFVEVTMVGADGKSDVLPFRETSPFREAWDRGGDQTLVALLETEYADLLDRLR